MFAIAFLEEGVILILFPSSIFWKELKKKPEDRRQHYLGTTIASNIVSFEMGSVEAWKLNELQQLDPDITIEAAMIKYRDAKKQHFSKVIREKIVKD